MRFRARLWLLASPLLGLAPPLRGQPTSQTQAGSPHGTEAYGEVQVGAGTQGDVTTGSSGTKAKPAKEAESNGEQTGPARSSSPGNPPDAAKPAGRPADKSQGR